MHRAFPNFIPSLRADHHLAGGAALPLDEGNGIFSGRRDAIVFREQLGFDARAHTVPLAREFSKLGGIAFASKFRLSLLVRESELLVHDRFVEDSLPGLEGLGFDQTGELEIFYAIDFLLAEGELMFKRLHLTVALDTFQLRSVSRALLTEIRGVRLHAATRCGFLS